MELRVKLALGLAVLSLGALPATGLAAGPDYQPDPPKDNPAPKGKAYGFHCKDQSKKHVEGEQGTPFSNCVKAMAQADRNEKLSAKKACKALSKKHVKGEKGTPFSQCVKGVAQMRKEERQAERKQRQEEREQATQA
jgi:hypothetical protein